VEAGLEVDCAVLAVADAHQGGHHVRASSTSILAFLSWVATTIFYF
jgi:hypothetical protein